MIIKITMDQRILSAATELFLRYGYSRVIIDDVARQLGISKKTIYNHFENKSALLHACIQDAAQRFLRQAELIIQDVDLSLRQKLAAYFQHLGMSFAQISQDFMQDLKRSDPQAWTVFITYRREIVQLHLGQLLEEGARVGYIRSDANWRLAVLVFITGIEQLSNPEYVSQFPESFRGSVSSELPERTNQLIQLLLGGLVAPQYLR